MAKNKQNEQEVEETLNYAKSASQEVLQAGDFVKVIPLNYDKEVVGSLYGINSALSEANAYVQWVENGEVKTALITMSDCELIVRN